MYLSRRVFTVAQRGRHVNIEIKVFFFYWSKYRINFYVMYLEGYQ